MIAKAVLWITLAVLSRFLTKQHRKQTTRTHNTHRCMLHRPRSLTYQLATVCFFSACFPANGCLKPKNVNHTDGFVAFRPNSTANKQQKHTTPTDEALWCRSLLCESRGRESSRSHVKRIIDPRVFGCAAPGIVPSQGNT